MEILNQITAMFINMPMALEVLLFFVLSVPYISIQQKRDPAFDVSRGLVRFLAWIILAVGLAKVGLSTALGKGFPPWMMITYVAMTAAVLALARMGFRFQVFVALCAAFAIYLAAQYAFTSITVTRTYPATWNLKTAPISSIESANPDYIEFTYTAAPEFFDYIYSDQISTFLMINKKRQVPVEVELVYHWGVLSGHRVAAVDGLTWQPERRDGAGVHGSGGSGPHPFPQYYLGFSQSPRKTDIPGK